MKENNEAYDETNRKWKSLCKILFGEEAGELSDYGKWLREDNEPRLICKSAISGKEVVFPHEYYSPGTPAIALDEVDFEKKYPPISINEIKDIDSLIAAISERACFTGNIILGNSKFVQSSTTVYDSYYVYRSERIAYAKYVAYSNNGSSSENIFGCQNFGRSQFLMRCGAVFELARCLALTKSDNSQDCYFSHGLFGCRECLFCFNIRTKRNRIGNLQLSPEKYAQLKGKLLAEALGMLKKNKRLPNIMEIAGATKPDYRLLKDVASGMPSRQAEVQDKPIIEDAFAKTAHLVLGAKPLGIDKCLGLLEKNSSGTTEDCKSCLSGKPIKLGSHYGWIGKFPRERLLTLEEADFTGEKLSLFGQETDSLNFENAPAILSKIAYFTPIWLTGTLRNNIDSPINLYSTDTYRGVTFIESRLCASCFMARTCEHAFGCTDARNLSFCINCNDSVKLTRCFECDNSSNCSDCYFIHNCENLHDCMFCFNVKNLRHAIGNYEVGKEEYIRIKKILLDALGGRIEKSGDFPLTIYNIKMPKTKVRE